MKMGPKSKGLIALVVGLGALAVAIVVSAADDPPKGNAGPPAVAPPGTPTTPPAATAPKPVVKPAASDFRVDKPVNQVAKIHRALLENSKAEFVETPLREVFDYLTDLHQVPIVIDTRVVPEDQRAAAISLQMSDVPMSAILDRILDSQKLDWVIRDNVLLVTTPRRAANLLETHYYDLTKLGRVDGTPADIVDLIGQLQEDRVPDDLNAQEQVPEATKKVLNQNNLLIVRDNRRGHDMIEKLLAAMAATAPEEEATTIVPLPRGLPMRIPMLPSLPSLPHNPAPQPIPMTPAPGAITPPPLTPGPTPPAIPRAPAPPPGER